MSEEEGDNWNEIFDRLAVKDGVDDGQIEGQALVKWLSAMNLEDRMAFEKQIPLDHHQLQRLVKQADKNNDGFVNKDEFQDLLQNKIRKLDQRQQSYVHQYFKIVAYAEEYSWCPPPWFILSMSLVQMILYYIRDSLLGNHVHFNPGCSFLIYSPDRKMEVWRFVTYIFIHVDQQHLWMNLCLQIIVGLPLEMSHGTWRVALVYGSGVIFGSLATSVIDPGIYLAGCSGGVYALVAAHFATLVLNWKEDMVIMQHRLRKSQKISVAKFHGKYVRWLRLLMLCLYIILDIVFAIRRRIKKDKNSVSIIAHLFGVIAGLMVGLIVLKNRKVQSWEVRLKNICILLFVVMSLFFILWNVIKDLAFNTTSALNFDRLNCSTTPI